MSPEIMISVLARLNALLEGKYHEHKQKLKRFKTLQLSLLLVSTSVGISLFLLYDASIVQMIFVLIGFNILFFVGFRPQTAYNQKSVKEKMQKVTLLQVTMKKYLMGEVVSFNGVECSADEGWICDKWGIHKDNERIDYGEFLYDKKIKGLYLEALRNKK